MLLTMYTALSVGERTHLLGAYPISFLPILTLEVFSYGGDHSASSLCSFYYSRSFPRTRSLGLHSKLAVVCSK